MTGEEAALLQADPSAARFVKSFYGADEYIKGKERFVLWIPDSEKNEALENATIASRVASVKENRLKSKRAATKELAQVPWRFGFRSYKQTESIIVPRHSSENRQYIPMGYFSPDVVISDAALAIYDAEPWVFALLTSSMHMAWVRAVGGQLETRLRYSNTIVYNNFPVPKLPVEVREKLTSAALRVLDVREYHCELILADLYDPDQMPDDLRAAHAELDELVDSIYSKRGYETDEQRLSDLFAMYERMITENAAKAPVKKSRSTKK